MSFPSEEHYQLLQKVGHMLSVWNDTEYQWKEALLRLEQPTLQAPSKTAKILVQRLDGIELVHAYRVIAEEMVEEPAKGRVLAGVAELNVLREYRNFYVHGFQAVGWSAGSPVGFLITTSAQSKLFQHDLKFYESDVDKLIASLEALRMYMGQICNYLEGRVDYTGAAAGLPRVPAPTKRLSKPKRYLFGERDPRDFGEPS